MNATMMKKLLSPVDLSPNSKAALIYAIHLAHDLNLSLGAFYSYPLAANNPFQSLENIQLMEQSLAQEAKAKLDIFLREVKGEIGSLYPELIETYTRLGIPIENILILDSTNEFELIVMGTRGSSNIQTKLLGTNTAVVLDNASHPVLVVPEGATYQPIQKIVFATDFSAQSISNIGALSLIAQQFASEIILLNVAKKEPDSLMRDRFVNEAKALMGYDNIHFEFHQDNDIEDGILEFVDSSKAQLFAMTIQERSIFQRIFYPSKTKNLALYSKIPLLAMHATR
jgi:nucleotide-binding universal stress UspA family protein